MKLRKSMSPSKTTAYKGNGKFGTRFGGCMITRVLTDAEIKTAVRIHAKHSPVVGNLYICAGTNAMKPLWLAQLDQGYDIESNISMDDLEIEMDKWVQKHIENGTIC